MSGFFPWTPLRKACKLKRFFFFLSYCVKTSSLVSKILTKYLYNLLCQTKCFIWKWDNVSTLPGVPFTRLLPETHNSLRTPWNVSWTLGFADHAFMKTIYSQPSVITRPSRQSSCHNTHSLTTTIKIKTWVVRCPITVTWVMLRPRAWSPAPGRRHNE